MYDYYRNAGGIAEKLHREALKLIWDIPLVPEQTPQSAIEESEPNEVDENYERI